MHYNCTLDIPLSIKKGASVIFSPVVEVSLPCHRCCRADRTMVLGEAGPAEHFGKAVGYDGHPFDGKVVNFSAEETPAGEDTDLVTARYGLRYEFQSFIDAKYPDRQVSPQPTWGRVHFKIRCVCNRIIEKYTQTNLVRPRTARCECGEILFVEQDQAVLFSEAIPCKENSST